MHPVYRLGLAAALTLAASNAFAAYEVTGPVSATACKGLVIKSCSSVTVAAVKGRDGRLYEMASRFETVDEYKESSSRCWINFSSGSLAITAWLIDAAKAPSLYARTASGEFEEISSVAYITFKCRRA